MSENLQELYSELGYSGALPGEPVLKGDYVSGEEKVAEKLQPLTEEDLKQVESLLKDDPEKTLQDIRKQWTETVEDDEIKAAFNDARNAFDNPATFVSELRSKRYSNLDQHALDTAADGKDELQAKLDRYPDIPVEPGETKYEPKGDALGWIVNTGTYWLRDKLKLKYEKPTFPFHDKYDSGFKYHLTDRDGNKMEGDRKITIALFSDWGTGLYHSRFIARHIEELEPDYAIHLGDVYYAGRAAEFKNNFNRPLEPVLRKSNVFTMNANHEMYSGGFHYFAYIGEKHKNRVGQVNQDQEGSYFCLWNDNYQIIGIDTAFHKNGRHEESKLQDWLGAQLQAGKNANPKRINILLSPNDPIALGGDDVKPLYNDLKSFIEGNLIDYWFWGNTHYAALFDRSDLTPFIGSCIGHGGHPIYREQIALEKAKHEAENKLPKPLWVDLSKKFPEKTGLRPELGNHGFCLMELDNGTVRLKYYDWLQELHRKAEFGPTW